MIFDHLGTEIPEDVLHFISKIQSKNFSNKTLSYEEDPYHVLDRIHNRKERKKIIKKLMSIGYDFKGPFPYNEISDEFPVLNTVHENLCKEDDFYSFYLKKGKTKHTAENLKCIIASSNKHFSSYAFRKGYDIYMNLEKSGSCTIILNPSRKRSFSLTPLHTKLSRREKDVWVLWHGNSVLKAEKTDLTKDEIMDYLLSFSYAL